MLIVTRRDTNAEQTFYFQRFQNKVYFILCAFELNLPKNKPIFKFPSYVLNFIIVCQNRTSIDLWKL